jgi:hypothetical protein
MRQEGGMSGKSQRKRWPWALLAIVSAILILAAAVALALALRTPAGRAAGNVVEYRARSLWSRWFSSEGGPTGEAGAIGGVVRDESGQPLADALVLVSTLKGVVYQAQSDGTGVYRIEGVPPGRYVPVADKWGYDATLYRRGTEERTLINVRAGEVTAGTDFTLYEHHPWRPMLDEPAILGPPQTGYALFPAEVAASRTPVTYTNEGLVITGTLLYEPLELDSTNGGSPPALMPVIVASYPSPAINWDRVSVALANEGYVVLATGISPQRGLDIHGMGRDLIQAVAYLRDGQLTDRADMERQGWLGGSFSSLILYRAMVEQPGGIDALIWTGAISDAFLGVQSLYDVELVIPPQYENAIASLGRPDRDPAFYLGYSPAFYAAQMPPALVIHTTADEVIPYNQSLRFSQALTDAGVPHELFLYEDTTHYLDQVNITPETAELYRRLALFLDKYVRQAE